MCRDLDLATVLPSREPHKALDCFFEGVHGLGHEEFLVKLLRVSTDVSATQLEILYYLKVSHAAAHAQGPNTRMRTRALVLSNNWKDFLLCWPPHHGR